MKKQRKLLTNEEKAIICRNTYMCDTCPLSIKLNGNHNCYTMVEHMEEAIKKYWNTEIDVDSIEPVVGTYPQNEKLYGEYLRG